MDTQIIAQCLAILQGKESRHTVGLSVELWQKYYEQAHSLYINNHVAILKDSIYMIKEHTPAWNRRVR